MGMCSLEKVSFWAVFGTSFYLPGFGANFWVLLEAEHVEFCIPEITWSCYPETCKC